MIPGSANPLLLADAGYQIQRSLRFRSSASAYLNRTPAVAGNRKTWTWSGWVKRGALGVRQGFFSSQNGAGNASLQFGFFDNDCFQMGNGNVYLLQSTAVYRDPSAWYHCVVNVDTTLASSRSKIYINGNQITTWATNVFDSNVAQNTDTTISNNLVHYLGQIGANLSYFDGYLSEINCIDGQALTPASFGEISPTTGQWQAKKYSGTYGTNGFYLPFTDNSAATAAAIGADKSGNGNNWTPNNISLTAGVTYDSMLDVPLGAGGGDRGNYAVLNPLDNAGSNFVLSNGNLTNSYNNNSIAVATFAVPDGKWYFEATATQVSTSIQNDWVGISSRVSDRMYAPNGLYYNGSAWAAYGATYTNGDVIGVSFDASNQTLEFFKNGASQGQKTAIGLALPMVPKVTVAGAAGNSISVNFGQRPFAYTPPTGFKALHTGNLPDPVIKLPAQYMAATTYTGDGVAGRAVTGVGFQPDLVWLKQRNGANVHQLTDSVRGALKGLSSNLTDAENTFDAVRSFTSDGYTLGVSAAANASASSYVGWQWKANGAAVANTAGSIASQVSAGVAQGFSVVTYTGTGANATVGHGLGVAPKMVIVKNRTGTARNWAVYNANLPIANGLLLDTTGAAAAYGFWNGTTPTSAVISLSSDLTVNTNGSNYVAYCFSEVAGYSKFGSYVGNANTDGPFVFCGFRPRYVMIKATSVAGYDWIVFDSARGTYNVNSSYLNPNYSGAEVSGGMLSLDFTANGFKIRDGNENTMNGSGVNYIFACFAEAPFKNSLAR